MKYRFITNAVLSAVLLAGGALSSPVLAENTNTGSTQINYTVDESYAWTAPASITFTADSNGSEAKTATVEVTQNTIGSGKTLKISIANDQAFDLTDSTNGANKREYTVKDGSTALSAGSEVLSIEAGTNTGNKDLTLQMVQAPVEVAGSYTGTLKFVSTIESAPVTTVAGTFIDGNNATLNDKDGNGTISKGDTVTFATPYLYADAGSNSPTEFLVLNSDGSTAELMATTNYQTSQFNTSGAIATDSEGNEVQQYEGSTLDTLLNNTYFNSLSSTVQSKIKQKEITQYTWRTISGDSGDIDSWYNKGGFTESDTSGSVYSLSKTGTIGTYYRNVYALDVQDVREYLGDSFTPQQLNEMFFGANASVNREAWLRSANYTSNYYAFCVYGNRGSLYASGRDNNYEVRPAFTISLN